MIQYIALFFFTAAAGVLSSFVWLMPNGLMASALAMCLSGATVWLGRKEKKTGAAPGLRDALAAGAVAGLVGGLLMAGLSEWLHPLRPQHSEIDFGPPKLPAWALLGLGMAYGMLLQRSYRLRRFSENPAASAIWSAVLGCFLFKTLATFVFLLADSLESIDELPGMLIGSVMLSLFGAVPFALLWMAATAWWDPHWKTPTRVKAELAENPALP